MGTRTRAERRHHRVRLVRRRMRIVRKVWDVKEWPEHPGQLAKFNLKCTCGMCSSRTYTRPENRRMRREERVRLRKESIE